MTRPSLRPSWKQLPGPAKLTCRNFYVLSICFRPYGVPVLQYHPDAVEAAAMVLPYFPNLSRLSLSAMPNGVIIPPKALKAAHLSSLPIETLDIIGGSSTGFVDPILDAASPTLQTLNICYYDGSPLTALGSPFPNLRSLCITSSCLRRPENLDVFLYRFTGLHSFI